MRERPLILLVDDEENFLEILSVKLQSSGFDTASAHNQMEALRFAEELQPDLILMDIHMGSGLSGTDIALWIKENPTTQNARVAFLTNMKNPWPGVTGANQDVSKELGMEDFIEKTEDLDAIVERVKEILGR